METRLSRSLRNGVPEQGPKDSNLNKALHNRRFARYSLSHALNLLYRAGRVLPNASQKPRGAGKLGVVTQERC